MALDIATLRRERDGAFYVSPARICLTAGDELTGEDDPLAVRLLVGAGGSIPAAVAEHYGLIGAPSTEPVEASSKAVRPPADKKRRPPEDKGRSQRGDGEPAPAGEQDVPAGEPAPAEA